MSVRGQHSFRTIVALVPLAIFSFGPTQIANCWQGGTASKGGSIRLEKPSQRPANNKVRSVYYRRIARSLNLNPSEVAAAYDDARKQNPALKFEMVIMAYWAAEQHSTSNQLEDGKKVVDALRLTRNSLALALRQVYSLTEEQAKDEERKAITEYNEAERKAHPQD